jgi:hypothetical protein
MSPEQIQEIADMFAQALWWALGTLVVIIGLLIIAAIVDGPSRKRR